MNNIRHNLRRNISNYFDIENLLWLVPVLLVLLLIAVPTFYFVNLTSDGKRVGVLTKFSYKGVVYKSYEGELVMGGYRNVTDNKGHSTTVANVWNFSCSNPMLAKQLDDLVGKNVKIVYHQQFAWIRRDTSYDVVSVEEVK